MTRRKHKPTPRLVAEGIALALLVGSTMAKAGPVVTTALAFESEEIDLDSGSILEVAPGESLGAPEADFHLAYHAGRTPHAVLFQNKLSGVEIAFLDETPFESIGWADVPGLTFGTGLVDQPLAGDDTVVLRTDMGAIYKIGNALESESAVVFDYQQLEEQTSALPAEPSAATIRLASQGPRRTEPPLGARAPADTPSTGLSPGDWAQIESLLRERQYLITKREASAAPAQAAVYEASNPTHRLRATFAASRVAIERVAAAGKPWTWEMALTGYGYAGAIRPAAAETIVADGRRLEIRRGDLVEWYVNDERGLEQGFTLAAPPQGGGQGPLAVHLAVAGGLETKPTGDGSALLLADASGKTILRYGGLAAWDAEGRGLPVWMAATEGGLALEVDDRGAHYPLTIDPLIVNETVKLLPGPEPLRYRFGSRVAIEGDSLLVAAPNANVVGIRSGTVFAFRRVAGVWTLEAELLPSEVMQGDQLGWGLALCGDVAAIGGYLNDSGGSSSGAVWIYRRTGTTWTQEALFPGEPGTTMGFAVGCDGDTVVTSTTRFDSNRGRVHVFRHDGTTWSVEALIPCPEGVPGDQFGWAVAVSGDTLLASAIGNDEAGSAAGAVYVFRRTGTSWSQEAKLIAGRPGDQLGRAVDLEGDTAVLGAQYNDDAGGSAGSAYVFRRSGTSWSQEATLIPSDVQSGDLFGESVALSGDLVAAGGSGADPLGSASGSAWLFARSGPAWSETAKLLPSDGAAADRYGLSVDLSGRRVVVGAWLRDEDHPGVIEHGAAYLFEEVPAGTQPPVALCRDVTAPVDAACLAEASIDDGSYDPEGGPVTFSQDPPGPYGLGSTLVTLTVEDDQGSTATCQATVTVADETPPAVNCPDPIELTADASCQALVPDLVSLTSASDNCAAWAELTLAQNPTLGSTIGLGDHAVTISATDPSGNTGSCSTLLSVPLHFDGFLPPVGGADATGGGYGDPIRTFKAGSTIPLKFALDCAGAPYTEGLHTLAAIQWSTETGSEPPIDATPQDAATTGNAFRLTGQEWHYNLDTAGTGMTPGQWEMVCTLADGFRHRVWIQLK